MSASPSQRWYSAVNDLFACARGRLPAAFLERRLVELGLPGVKPLVNAELPKFEKAVDLINALIDGRPAPGGAKPEAAIEAAFPADHPTLGGLKALAQEYVAVMRPAKKGKAAPVPEPAPAPERRGDRGDRVDRRPVIAPPRGDRGDRGDRGERVDRRPVIAPPQPRLPRIPWDAYLARHLAPPAASVPAPAPADAPAPSDAPAPVEGAAPAPATAPAAAPAEPEFFTPPALRAWTVDADAKRQLERIRERIGGVLSAKNAGGDPAAAIRELAFAILRPPLPVRDDLRALIAEHLQAQGVQLTISALYPPPPVAALKRDWENLLQARGPADPAVAAAWKKLLDAHPEARAKLEQEREQELADLMKRYAGALRDPDAAAAAAEIRARVEARFAGAAEQLDAAAAQARAAAEAAAQAGRLVAERHWADAEVVAAIAALEPAARDRLLVQRRHELDELDRRFRAALKDNGPDHEATQAALAKLTARFPTEGANAQERLARIRRGEGLAQQERERREAGRSLSVVHLGAAEHRLTRLRPAAAWRLVVAASGLKSRGSGHVVGLLMQGAAEHGPVAADWRAAECGNLDELDAAVQAVADREGGVLGLPLADCVNAGGGWNDAVAGLAALIALALPTAGETTVTVELPAWAEPPDAAALDACLAGLGKARGIAFARAAATDHAAALAEAVVWSWGGRREAEVARIRQSGLASTCLLEPGAALRDTVRQLAAGALPEWQALGSLVLEAQGDAGGLAEALLARIAERLAADADATAALHRHLTGLARGRIADAQRLVSELAWFDAQAGARLRPRDQLRLEGARVAAGAAAGGLDPAVVERLAARLAELREDWPSEVLEVAILAAAQAREALDPERAEALLAPWARAEAIACGGRALQARLIEERARIAATTGRMKDARKHLERAEEVAAKMADPAERLAVRQRLAQLRVAVLCDDAAADAAEAQAALVAVIGDADPVAAAGELAVAGIHGRRHAHHALLRFLVRRRDEVMAMAYTARREEWCDVREAPGAQISALRAVLVAPTDAAAALALLKEGYERLGGETAPATLRLSWAACAVACALHGAVAPELKDRLTALRRQHQAATPAVTALERGLALAPDVDAGLAEALPLLARG